MIYCINIQQQKYNVNVEQVYINVEIQYINIIRLDNKIINGQLLIFMMKIYITDNK